MIFVHEDYEMIFMHPKATHSKALGIALHNASGVKDFLWIYTAEGNEVFGTKLI